jgi:hypothetical protein
MILDKLNRSSSGLVISFGMDSSKVIEFWFEQVVAKGWFRKRRAKTPRTPSSESFSLRPLREIFGLLLAGAAALCNL